MNDFADDIALILLKLNKLFPLIIEDILKYGEVVNFEINFRKTMALFINISSKLENEVRVK